MNEPADHPKRRADLNVRLVDGEVVVLDRQSNLIHQLNQAASFIWDRCNGQSTVAEIANQLATAFDVDATMAVHDVAIIIRRFHCLGLMETASNLPENS